METKLDFDNPTIEKPHNLAKEGIGTGTQKLWRFPNNYGASVVQVKIMGIFGSYTNDETEWELAVIKWEGKKTYRLVYDTPITDDVIGHLKKEEVIEILNKISKLEE